MAIARSLYFTFGVMEMGNEPWELGIWSSVLWQISVSLWFQTWWQCEYLG